MYVLNPHIVVSKTFLMQFFGYPYAVKLHFATERNGINYRTAIERTALHELCKSEEEVDHAIDRIRSKVSGKAVYVVGAPWRDEQ